MVYTPTLSKVCQMSPTTRVAAPAHREPEPTESSTDNRQLLGDFDFNSEVQIPGSLLTPDSLQQYNTTFPDTISMGRDPSTEATTNYTHRAQSPFCGYLSPGYSSAHSPSMASDGMYELSQQQKRVWMMTPTRDTEGSTPYCVSTPTSSVGTTNVNPACTFSYQLSFSDGTPSTWSPGHQETAHQSEQLGSDFGEGQTASNPTNVMHLHQAVPSNYYGFANLSDDSSTGCPFVASQGFMSPSAAAGLSSYEQHAPFFQGALPLPQETQPGARSCNSAAEGHGMANASDAAHPRAPQAAGRSALVWRSNKKTVEDLPEKGHGRKGNKLVCLFQGAGCPTLFKGKNEWKRHLKYQHFLSKLFVCPACGLKEFSRKDLFKHHFMRMHCSREDLEAWKRKSATPAVLARLEEALLQAGRARRDPHPPPPARECFMEGCESLFAEPDSWVQCLEHVAKHYYATANGQEEERQCKFTPEQLQYFQQVGAIVPQSHGWTLGAQSNGERARRNKKKVTTRETRQGPQGSNGRSRGPRRVPKS